MPTTRFNFPPDLQGWHMAVWEWDPEECYWLLVSCTVNDNLLKLGETSQWAPPEDGGGTTEVWTIAKRF